MINLHTHTEYSNGVNLDSINKIRDVIEYSHALGHKGIAITDHESLAGHMEAINIAKELGYDDFKLILGNEIYLCKEDCKESHIFPHFILLAKNARGNRALRELSTIANCENSFTWVSQRKPTYYDDLFKVLNEYKGDLIASTACAGGALGKLILRGIDEQMIMYWLKKMEDAFGEGNFFMEMQPSVQDEQMIINKKIVELSEITGIPYIITTDAHYLTKEYRSIHDAFLKSQEADRETGDFYATTYLMGEGEIREYLSYLGKDVLDKAFENSEKIGDMVEEYELEKPLNIPYMCSDDSEADSALIEEYSKNIPLIKFFADSEWPSDRHLVKQIIDGMEREPEVFKTKRGFDEIEYELNSIKLLSEKQNTPWSAYLLTTKDIVAKCWEAGSLVGCGRGSGGGFVILYLLDIIGICSLKEEMTLYPWRFL